MTTSGFQGMDVAWVQSKGRILETTGAEVDAIKQGVERVRNESSNPKLWSGADQQRFAGWYDSEGRVALQQAAKMLQALGQNFQSNAAGQLRVSQ
jgi:hypothetical protein